MTDASPDWKKKKKKKKKGGRGQCAWLDKSRGYQLGANGRCHSLSGRKKGRKGEEHLGEKFRESWKKIAWGQQTARYIRKGGAFKKNLNGEKGFP